MRPLPTLTRIITLVVSLLIREDPELVRVVRIHQLIALFRRERMMNKQSRDCLDRDPGWVTGATLKKGSRSRSRAAVPVGRLMLIGLLFLFPIAETNAQDVLLTIPAGRAVIADKEVYNHNAHRLQVAIFSVVRTGSDNTYPRRKIRMELVNPSGSVVASLTAGIGHDSNQAVNGRTGSSRSDPYLLTAPAALGGSSICSRWMVRLVDAETGTVPNPDPSSQKVTAVVEFNRVLAGPSLVTISAPSKFGIVQSDTVEKNISVPFTGNITIQANWDTDEFTLDNYELKFSLINSKGNIVASNTGYSRDSLILGISSSQRMKITYEALCTDFGGTQSWKIRVRGSSKGKVKNVDLKASIDPPFILDPWRSASIDSIHLHAGREQYAMAMLNWLSLPL